MQTEIVLSSPATRSELHVRRFGAHVTAWKVGDEHVLFMSERAHLDGTKSIRGGIPIVFPQFGPRGPLGQHGFARTAIWELEEHTDNMCQLSLADTVETLSSWPHKFTTRIRYELADSSLVVTWTVENTDDKPLLFTAALHSYFNIPSVADVTVEGLQRSDYFVDQLTSQKVAPVAHGTWTGISCEVDRVYANVSWPIVLNQSISIESQGFSDVVFWNPWIEKNDRIADLQPEAYKKFVCIEPGAIESAVTVMPRCHWSSVTTFSKLP